MAAYVNTSIHFPNPELLERIRAAAKRLGVTPGTFIRQAAERAVEQQERKTKKRAA